MKYKPVRDRCCQNEKCQDHSKFGEGNIIRHSKYKAIDHWDQTKDGTTLI